MIIDSHEHVILPIENQIKLLDKAKIDKAILFSTTPHVENAKDLKSFEDEMNILYHILSGANGSQERINSIKKANTQLYQSIQQKPERFLGFGGVPLGLTQEETNQWIEQNIIPFNFKGIGEFTPGNELQMQQLEQVFRSLEENIIMPVWIHTFNPVTGTGIKILMDLCKKYSNIPVIFGHLGGTNWIDVIKFAKEQKNIYLDLSAAFASIATKTALFELPERCLFSSDAPYGEPYLYRQLIEFVSPSPQIAAMALGENIATLLRL